MLVGDRVKVISVTDNNDEYYYEIGFEGIIIRDVSEEEDEYDFSVKFDIQTKHMKDCKSRSNEWLCKDRDLELIKKEDINMKKTFKEVIVKGIKKGEIWEGNYENIIGVDDGVFDIEWKEGREDREDRIIVDAEYILQRKKVSFMEAFHSLDKDVEIENCNSGTLFKAISYKKKYDNEWNIGIRFTTEDIKGEFYINN